MDEIIKICKIGAIIQQALVGEGEATRDYMNQLAQIAELSPEVAAICSPVIEEIVADELDHERKLWALYQTVTDIAANKE